MIYLVISGEYSDWNIECYFDNIEYAERYCAIKNTGERHHYVEEVREATVKIISDCDYYEIVKLYYGGEHLTVLHRELSMDQKMNKIEKAAGKDHYVITLCLSQKERSREIERKIAYDLLARYKADEEGI